MYIRFCILKKFYKKKKLYDKKIIKKYFRFSCIRLEATKPEAFSLVVSDFWTPLSNVN